MAPNLTTDSPLSRRIVLSFLDFLKSVEPAPGADIEGLEVVKECLQEVFKLNPSSIDSQTEPGFLVACFSPLTANKQHESCVSHATTSLGPSASSSLDAAEASLSQLPKPQDELGAAEPHTLEVSKDELFGLFFSALDKIDFFRRSVSGEEDHDQVEKASYLFHKAVLALERSGCQAIESRNLAETFKTEGNQAMQSKLYSDAIELYTYAIALCGNNAVYFCNRAAAYTQIEKYMEAISDCHKSIEIDPNYSKAYSRLGLAYYAQGNYSDAIDKGFVKALQLDPNNDSVKENIRVTVQRLTDQHRAAHYQNGGSTSHSNQEPNGQQAGASYSFNVPVFSSMPFSPASPPPDFSSMFADMANVYNQGPHPQERPHDDSDAGRSNEPEVGVGGNISFGFGDDVPEELMGTWRSVMGMFSGAQPPQNQQGDGHRGSTPN